MSSSYARKLRGSKSSYLSLYGVDVAPFYHRQRLLRRHRAIPSVFLDKFKERFGSKYK